MQFSRSGLLGAAYLAMPSAQTSAAPWNRQRPVALPGRRRREHPLFPARPGDTGELRDAQRGVALQPAGRRRSDDRARDAELRRREAPERRRAAASRRVDRSDEREAALELRRAARPTGRSTRCAPPTAKGVAYHEINGRGVVYIATPGFFLFALDAETGKPLENWGRPVRASRVSANRRRGSRRGSDSRLGAVDQSEAQVQPERGRAARARLHHQLVAADRRQRRRSSSATPPSRAITRRARRTCPATSSRTTRGPGSSCGSST